MSALRHDVTDPDPLCLGDDPCICVQLQAARRDTLQYAITALVNLRGAL